MSRAPYKPTEAGRENVRNLIGAGFRVADVAKAVGIDEKTLRKYYPDECESGHLIANGRVAQALFEKAMGDGPASVTACIFWLKCRAGWIDRQEVQVTTRTVARIPPPHQTVDEWLAECLIPQPDPTKVH